RLAAKTAAGEVSVESSQNSTAARNEHTAMQRSAANQRSAICPASSGASKEPIACVAQHQPISVGEKPSSFSRNENRGMTAPCAEYSRKSSSERRVLRRGVCGRGPSRLGDSLGTRCKSIKKPPGRVGGPGGGAAAEPLEKEPNQRSAVAARSKRRTLVILPSSRFSTRAVLLLIACSISNVLENRSLHLSC